MDTIDLKFVTVMKTVLLMSDFPSFLLQALCQCGRLKGRATNGAWGLGSRIPLAADPACRPLAFTIVFTDREPGTGYSERSRKHFYAYAKLWENSNCS